MNLLFTQVLSKGSGGGAAVPVSFDSLYDFVSADLGANDASWKNKKLVAVPSKNIIYNSSGLIPSEGSFGSGGASITQHFANGPNYSGSAVKIVLSATVGGESTGSFWKPFFNRQFNVGDYIFRCKMKTAVPGVTQKIRWGFSTTSPTNLLDIDDNWQTVSMPFTSASNAFNYYIAVGSQLSLGGQSILVDELQLYSTADTIPNYTDDGNDGHINKPFGARYPITKNGSFVTNTPLALISPSYPDAKTWSEMTFLIALRVNSDATQIILSTLDDSGLGTTTSTLNYILTAGEISVSVAAENRTGKLTNQGFVVLGFSFNGSSSYSYVNEVTIRISTGRAAFAAQVMSLLCRLATSSPVLGDVAFVDIWDTQMTTSQWAANVRKARLRLVEMGASAATRNWYIAEGDSITASFSNPQGESYAYRMSPELFNTSEYLGILDLGTGGHTLSIVESELSYMLARIAEVIAGGGKAIVSLLIGRNDNGTLISNGACDAYWVRLKAYYASCRAAGAKVIAISCLPSGLNATNGGPSGSWETYRNYLNGLMRAEPSAYDALADFGNPSVSIMGDVATCENTTYYEPGGVHPYPGGHTILATIIKPVIQSLL
ncbi:MAG: SGNH/GDSL hydrolase family protein [Chryseolinea sp.]